MVQCWWARTQFLRLPRYRWFSAKLLIGLLEWRLPWYNLLRTVSLRYASLFPGWSYMRYIWQLMLRACEPTVGGNDPALVLSYEDDHCEVYRSHFLSYVFHTKDTLLWMTFNQSETSCFVWNAESKATIWTISNDCMPLCGMSLQYCTQTEWSWYWYWPACGVRYVYMPVKWTQGMPVKTLLNTGPDWIMNVVPRWIRPLVS